MDDEAKRPGRGRRVRYNGFLYGQRDPEGVVTTSRDRKGYVRVRLDGQAGSTKVLPWNLSVPKAA